MEKDKEILLRFADCVDNNSKALEKLADALHLIISNNNAIIDNLGKLNDFAHETFKKFNHTLIIIDALSICLFEKGVIEQDKFSSVMEQLAAEHEKRMKEEEKHECDGGCNGGCEHEAEGKTDSAGTKGEEVHV